MKDGAGPAVAFGSLALLGIAGAAILAVLGTGTSVLRGAAIGLALGWTTSALELRILRSHLRTDFNRALRIVTAGFGLRAVGILIGMSVLDRTAWADGTAFGVGVVGGFIAFLPFLAAAVNGVADNGEARG